MCERRECVTEPFTISANGTRYKMTYVLDNTDNSDMIYLCSLLDKNNCDYKVVWQSKFDRSFVQETEPKIYNAFNCIVIALGTLFNLNTSINCFKLRNDRIKFLESCYNEGTKGITRWIDVERENQPINYEKLANSIIASLYLQP